MEQGILKAISKPILGNSRKDLTWRSKHEESNRATGGEGKQEDQNANTADYWQERDIKLEAIIQSGRFYEELREWDLESLGVLTVDHSKSNVSSSFQDPVVNQL